MLLNFNGEFKYEWSGDYALPFEDSIHQELSQIERCICFYE
jgi:hypothetical protein